MGNSDHGTTHMRVGWDDGELRPWHYIYEGRMRRWVIPNMALHTCERTRQRAPTAGVERISYI